MTVHSIQRCQVCGQPITDEDDYHEGHDDPDLCEACQEVK